MTVNKTLSLVVAFSISACGLGSDRKQSEESGPKGPFAVVFDIDGEMPQFPRPPGSLSPPVTSQHRLQELFEKASADFRVQEIAVHIGNPMISLARAQELVDVLRKTAEAGKPLVCHVDAVDNIGYWIAAQGCPKILISPAGWVQPLGLSMETLYMRELLASIGVDAEMIAVGMYKNAAEPLTRDSMSEAAKEAATAMLNSMHRVFVDGIAAGRKIAPADIQNLIDNGPHDAETSVNQKLVDQVGTLESHLSALAAKYSGGVVEDYGKPPHQQFSLSDFWKLLGADKEKEEPQSPHIAMVPVIGPIAGGGGGDDLFGSMEVVRERELTGTLRALAQDDSVKAVVLRIDSPGGSALASDNIWHSVRTMAEKKPVIASLGDVAASGGYYIAAGATEIVAEPATLTGSIGVVGGKLVFSEAAKKLGVTSERLATGRRAGMLSPLRPFTDEEHETVQTLMNKTYHLFVDRVSKGRGMPKEKVLAVAEGRVWTGRDARKGGLVNEMGGLQYAIERARTLASLPAGTPVKIVPKPKSLMEIIGEALSEPQSRVTQSLAKMHPSISHGLSFANLLLNEQVLAFSPLFLLVR